MFQKELLSHWQLAGDSIEQIYSSAWRIDQQYVIKRGTKLNQLQVNLALIKGLSDYGIPVAKVIPTVSGEQFIQVDEFYYLLMEKVPGSHIDALQCLQDGAVAFRIGEIIATLHEGFKACEGLIQGRDNDFMSEMNGWIAEVFKEHQIQAIPEAVLSKVYADLKSLYSKLPRQLIHRDIHLNNLLFEDHRLTGYIDFDLCQVNVRVFDLCYMALNFLTEHLEMPEIATLWTNALKRLVEGYEVSSPLTSYEKSAILPLMMAIEILFVAYFTRLGDHSAANGAAVTCQWLWEHSTEVVSVLEG